MGKKALQERQVTPGGVQEGSGSMSSTPLGGFLGSKKITLEGPTFFGGPKMGREREKTLKFYLFFCCFLAGGCFDRSLIQNGRKIDEN